jgi:hypothetical protein
VGITRARQRSVGASRPTLVRSLQRPRPLFLRPRIDDWLAFVTAASATCASFVVILLSSYRGAPALEPLSRQRGVVSERIVLVVLVVLVVPHVAPAVERSNADVRSTAEVGRRALRSAAAPPRDSVSPRVRSSTGRCSCLPITSAD